MLPTECSVQHVAESRPQNAQTCLVEPDYPPKCACLPESKREPTTPT
ncbi:hypothetical protein EHYA_02036 [Embleya hyalina]|uniref:Uncharacterized protein n=1 Tax=Embleya hyalina TaxID=516124 RepID=A0A401YID9_9ACTN|nr:hypothetical protein EHYA_02036 [Embleya hyalina]